MNDMKVVIGLSGGVDSSYSAWSLKQQGYEVIGVTMTVFKNTPSAADIEDAKNMAAFLGIEHQVISMEEEFREFVINPFIEDYLAARTPNPCALCNRHVKFKMLMKALEKFGADKIATGHYANVVFDENTKRYAIAKSKYVEKDQSYILYNLSQESLSRLVLPLSNYTKTEVRKKAAEVGIVLSQKRDSFDICFIKDGDYKKFIENEMLGYDYKEKLASGETVPSFLERGHFIDKEGTVLGWHDGIINYTVGQRRGIAIDVGEINKKSNLKFDGRAFVGEINAIDNTVTLVSDEDLFKDELFCSNVNFQLYEDIKEPIKALCKIRYKDEGVYGILSKEEGGIYKFKFDKKVRAIARGQSAVFYIDDKILCGGIIQ